MWQKKEKQPLIHTKRDWAAAESNHLWTQNDRRIRKKQRTREERGWVENENEIKE